MAGCILDELAASHLETLERKYPPLRFSFSAAPPLPGCSEWRGVFLAEIPRDKTGNRRLHPIFSPDVLDWMAVLCAEWSTEWLSEADLLQAAGEEA